MITRRSLLIGLSALAAPAIIRTPGILMPAADEIGPFVELDCRLPYGFWRVKNFTVTLEGGETLYWPRGTMSIGRAA